MKILMLYTLLKHKTKQIVIDCCITVQLKKIHFK